MLSNPALKELIGDPIYRKMFTSKPRLHANLAHGNPWRVWAFRDGKVSKADASTYSDAFAIVKARLKTYDDLAIVSLRQMFSPPPGLVWEPGQEWCSRCRRPVVFAFFRRHHACRDSILIDQLDEDARCPYCGMRREAMPAYTHDGQRVHA